MREKARIKRITRLLEKIWENRSDERFGQLLINLQIVEDDLRLWQQEDDLLENYLEKINENKN